MNNIIMWNAFVLAVFAALSMHFNNIFIMVGVIFFLAGD